MKQLPSRRVMRGDLAALGLACGERELGLVQAYRSVLGDWVGRMNLIGPREMDRLWERHLLESASWSLLLPEDGAVCDIGSGAGFPGVMLAILGRTVTLLEPRRPKYLFLTAVRDALGIPGLSVERTRIEDRPPPAFPSFVARSVGPVAGLLDSLAGAGAGGSLLVCRVPPGSPELAAAERWIDLPVPPLDRPGVLVQYRVPAASLTRLRRK